MTLANANASWCPSTTTHHRQQQLHSVLKINKDSHVIKKPSSATSSSSSSSASSLSPPPPKPQQRHPVIIYTHSPKVIHTHPKDFMALVQKLTGMSRDQEDDKKKIDVNNNNKNNNNSAVNNLIRRERDRNHIGNHHDEHESLSGITTTEDICSNPGDCLGAPSMVFHHHEPPLNSYAGNMTLPFYAAALNNNSNNNNNNHINNYNELLSCTSTTDHPYDFIDFDFDYPPV